MPFHLPHLPEYVVGKQGVPFGWHLAPLPDEESIGLHQPDLAERIHVEVHPHSHHVYFVHFLQVVAELVAHLQAVVNWSLP